MSIDPRIATLFAAAVACAAPPPDGVDVVDGGSSSTPDPVSRSDAGPGSDARTDTDGDAGDVSGMTALRTPEARFDGLPGYDFEPHYVFVDDYEGGRIRMHYLDEGPSSAPTVFMMHGNPTWSYMFRNVVPRVNAAGYRTIVVDFIGMGRSDKPADFDDYTYDRHVGWVEQLFSQLDAELELGPVTIFGHDYGTPIGIRLMADHYPERFDAFVNANASLPDGTFVHPVHRNWRQFVRDNPDVPIGHVLSANVTPGLSRAEIRAYDAPYPDARYKAAIRSFPEMVPDSPTEPEAVANRAAWTYMETFSRPFMTIFGAFDAVDLPSGRMGFIERVPGAFGQPHPQLDVTHYAPEDDPERVASELIAFLDDVYHDEAFVELVRSSFERGPEPFISAESNCRRVAGAGAVRIEDDAEGCLTSSLDLRGFGSMKLAFRFLPVGVVAADQLKVEFWDGSGWDEVASLSGDFDFRSGADDYALIRVDLDGSSSLSDARLRFRLSASDGSGGSILVSDLAVHALP